MLFEAVYAGIDVFTFWEMTLAEIALYVKVYNKRQEETQKQNAMYIYNLANLCGVAFASSNPLNNGKVKFPSIYDVFPTLFEKEKPKQQDWRIAKQNLLNYANAHNKKRQSRGEIKK